MCVRACACACACVCIYIHTYIYVYIQGILWNVQMYIDGYVPDYFYTYKAKYAPDARAIARWVEEQEFDPFPNLEMPLSLVKKILTCFFVSLPKMEMPLSLVTIIYMK